MHDSGEELDPRSRSARDERLFPLLEDELRRIAHGFMRRERKGATLQTTALINEAWVRLADRNGLAPEDRGLVVRLASSEMRRILVDRARRRMAFPPRSRDDPDEFAGVVLPEVEPRGDLVDLDVALVRLAEQDRRACTVVELVFFGGRTHAEAAEILDVSAKTVQRDWEYASSFLRREMAR